MNFAQGISKIARKALPEWLHAMRTQVGARKGMPQFSGRGLAEMLKRRLK